MFFPALDHCHAFGSALFSAYLGFSVVFSPSATSAPLTPLLIVPKAFFAYIATIHFADRSHLLFTSYRYFISFFLCGSCVFLCFTVSCHTSLHEFFFSFFFCFFHIHTVFVARTALFLVWSSIYLHAIVLLFIRKFHFPAFIVRAIFVVVEASPSIVILGSSTVPTSVHICCPIKFYLVLAVAIIWQPL